jgi:hypothetical protein
MLLACGGLHQGALAIFDFRFEESYTYTHVWSIGLWNIHDAVAKAKIKLKVNMQRVLGLVV